MASQPMPDLAASAMNALAHAVEALYGPMRQPGYLDGRTASGRAVRLGLGDEEPRRDDLALASILAGYAVGCAGFAVHHAVCQTTVRVPRHAARADERGDAAAHGRFVAARDPRCAAGRRALP